MARTRKDFPSRVKEMVRRNQDEELEEIIQSSPLSEAGYIAYVLHNRNQKNVLGYHLNYRSGKITFYKSFRNDEIGISDARDIRQFDISSEIRQKIDGVILSFVRYTVRELMDHPGWGDYRDRAEGLLREAHNAYLDIRDGESTTNARSLRRKLNNLANNMSEKDRRGFSPMEIRALRAIPALLYSLNSLLRHDRWLGFHRILSFGGDIGDAYRDLFFSYFLLDQGSVHFKEERL